MKDDNDDDKSVSSASMSGSDDDDASIVSSRGDDSNDRKRKHQKRKKHKKDKKKISDNRHRSKKHHKKKKDKKKKKDRKRKRSDDDDSSSLVYSSSSHSDDNSNAIKKRKKERKRHRKEGKKRKSNDHGMPIDDNTPTRSQIVAQALHNLLMNKPEFASELPIILIRLAGGTKFELRQVTDPTVSMGLQSIFRSMEFLGVKQDDDGMWLFQAPPGAGRHDELVLLRVIRTLLDDVGMTMDRIESFEDQQQQQEENKKNEESKPSNKEPQKIKKSNNRSEDKQIKDLTFKLLNNFQAKDAELASQLASLCQTIATGESISLDGLPDETLKSALESLFDACGLEKSEMENDDSDDDEEEDDEDSPLMGYGIPENADDSVQTRLASIMAACREGPPKRRAVGPMKRPATTEEEEVASEIYGNNPTNEKEIDDEDDEDGPLLPGAAQRGPAISAEMIKAQAEYRELQLKATAAGVPMPIQGGREEWMIVPGKYDFLSNIKSGQPITSRGFQNKKARNDDAPAAPIHPAVQAEMDAIMQAHQDARGPSLFDQHRAKIQKEKELAAAAAAAAGGKKEFKWTRDKDLDAGRRVDKDALGMILGGASDNLKSKFQGGFNR